MVRKLLKPESGFYCVKMPISDCPIKLRHIASEHLSMTKDRESNACSSHAALDNSSQTTPMRSIDRRYHVENGLLSLSLSNTILLIN